ncbi:TPA: LPO_1073 family protein [Legionella anisa]
MDPMTSLVISSAIGGAAGSFITELSSNGFKWLCDLVTAQSPEMQEIAKNNMENFVTRLAQRVERLEKEIPADKSEIFQNALNHPSSALIIKNAIIDSATTDNEDKHELLSELIAHRLTANADDMIALAGGAACSIVNSLSSRQIKLLSVLTSIKDIRPLNVLEINDEAVAKDYLIQWWHKSINPLITDSVLVNTTALDYEHLAAMGCIRISIGTSNLLETISLGITKPVINLSEQDLINENWFQLIKSQWEGLGHATSSSIGRIIGILHRDAKLKSTTTINW